MNIITTVEYWKISSALFTYSILHSCAIIVFIFILIDSDNGKSNLFLRFDLRWKSEK